MANIARHLKLDPEAALRDANQKFIRRFAHIETRLAERRQNSDAIFARRNGCALG